MNMNMNAGLYQQQTLKLSMTQELSQAIALLQYSSQELTMFLEDKWLENPLLSIESSPVDSFHTESRMNRKQGNPSGGSGNWIEHIGEDLQSLEQYLFSQLDGRQISKTELKVYLQLIRNMDENGYIRITMEDVASFTGASLTDVTHSLHKIQELEPFGIGARDLQECLLIQARLIGGNDLAEKLLGEYFSLFVEKKWRELTKILEISLKEIQDAFDYVQTLNPRPGSTFYIEKASYIVPDVAVKNTNGLLTVGYYGNNSPKLSINKPYLKQMQSCQDKNVDRYLQDKWQEYRWLSKGIQQRRETILHVMKKIAEIQTECFFQGMECLKPMTMKEIADELEIHESTVSRAVRGKYVQTPFGTIEMRSFFSSSLSSTEENDISGTKAKKVLEAVVNKEDKLKPLSDQDLTEQLKSEFGIVLSRRTVAKYREQLGIPASTKRKRYE